MSRSSRLRLLAACMLFLLPILACVLPVSGPNPTDKTLIAAFEMHRADFEALLTMWQEDRARAGELEKISLDYTRPDDLETLGISTARLEEYRQLLQRIGALSISTDFRDGVEVLVWAGGAMPDDGAYQGYLYLPTGLRTDITQVSEVDPYEVGAQNEPVWVARPIDDNWYIYYMY